MKQGVEFECQTCAIQLNKRGIGMSRQQIRWSTSWSYKKLCYLDDTIRVTESTVDSILGRIGNGRSKLDIYHFC